MEIRPPELTEGSEAEQLRRLHSYLCTLSEQLQFAFDALESGGGGEKITYAPSARRRQEDMTRLKSLILKSAQVTEVLEQRLEQRLEGKYVAQSQFGDYCRETGLTIAATSRAIEQQFASLERLDSAVDSLDSQVRQVSATIRTGEVADGVYGVEIGQQETRDGVLHFRCYARLTAQKLSFFDSNDVEVAYISNRCMYVTAADAAAITAQSLSAPRFQQQSYTWQVGEDGHLSLR